MQETLDCWIHMFVIVSILSHEAKAVILPLMEHNWWKWSQVRYTKRQGVGVDSLKVSLQLTQSGQEVTYSMPPLKLCQNFLIELSCYRHHKLQLERISLANYVQLICRIGKVANPVLKEKRGKKQKNEAAISHEFNTSRAGVRYIRTLISAEKTAVSGCLTNALAPPPIVLESCSMAQNNRPV